MISNRELETMPARSVPRLETLQTAEVRGHGFCRMTRAEIPSYRRHPEHTSAAFPPLQPSALRHSDDQTIAALAAVQAAVQQMGAGDPGEFERWGILVASRFLGRSSLLAAIDRFDSEGVWGVSPHLIPHYALHSPAGTLSLALGIHGPSLGIGGGTRAGFEGFLAALCWLGARVVPGLWFVQTAWSPEFIPDQRGEPLQECACHALALALVHSSSSKTNTPALRLVTSRVPRARAPLTIGEQGSLLARSSARRPGGDLPISSEGRTYVHHSGSGNPPPHFSRNARTRSTARTIADDGSGRTRVELILPHLPQVREDD